MRFSKIGFFSIKFHDDHHDEQSICSHYSFMNRIRRYHYLDNNNNFIHYANDVDIFFNEKKN